MIYEHFALRNIKIFPARREHSSLILDLIKPYFEKGIILPRTLEDIEAGIDNFIVAENAGVIVGCAAVHDFDEGLYEIRSLAVEYKFSGKGIGAALIAYAVDYAREVKNGKSIFALTLRPNVFMLVGFKIVLKEMFPKKVWKDCSVCVKKDHCDEIAVLYEY